LHAGQLCPRKRSAVRRGVQLRRQVADEESLIQTEARWHILAGPVQDKSCVNDLRIEAAELRELRRTTKLVGLPLIGFCEAAVRIFGLDGTNPGHTSLYQPRGSRVTIPASRATAASRSRKATE